MSNENKATTGGQVQPPPQTIKGQVAVFPLLQNMMKESNFPDSLIKFIQERYEFGLKKYGTPLMSPNGRDMMKDAKDEIGDLAQYLAGCIHQARICRSCMSG